MLIVTQVQSGEHIGKHIKDPSSLSFPQSFSCSCGHSEILIINGGEAAFMEAWYSHLDQVKPHVEEQVQVPVNNYQRLFRGEIKYVVTPSGLTISTGPVVIDYAIDNAVMYVYADSVYLMGWVEYIEEQDQYVFFAAPDCGFPIMSIAEITEAMSEIPDIFG